MERGTELDRARVFRVRAYLDGRVRDVERSFRVAADADLAAAMKRAALAALPKSDGWRYVVISVERIIEAEPVAAALDRLARRHMLGRDRAAALAVTTDGGRAVLAVAARGAAVIERLRAALAGKGR